MFFNNQFSLISDAGRQIIDDHGSVFPRVLALDAIGFTVRGIGSFWINQHKEIVRMKPGSILWIEEISVCEGRLFFIVRRSQGKATAELKCDGGFGTLRFKLLDLRRDSGCASLRITSDPRGHTRNIGTSEPDG